eukprot:IDg2342t1
MADESCPTEYYQYVRSFAGALNYIGQAVIPPAAFIASWSQQQLPRLKYSHIIRMNKMLSELLKLSPSITNKAPFHKSWATEAVIVCSSDAAHGNSSYSQTVYIGGLFLQLECRNSLYHAVYRHSGKQRRVSFSSAGAEIIAAAESTDRGGYLHELFITILGPNIEISMSLLVDSRDLHDTITKLHEPRDYRLWPTVARIRDSFESKKESLQDLDEYQGH